MCKWYDYYFCFVASKQCDFVLAMWTSAPSKTVKGIFSSYVDEALRGYLTKLDEVDMGMTYNEVSAYGRLRKIFRCGPVSMFKNLYFGWGSKLKSF
ncbi:glutamine-dependent NAD(+) synthetase [Artemisia annua]|uniref:Glutamine-dependent NAD(+) synthetase n=1 Tax=Artemisia annua TaxID=35608 RepID=A0A2U1LP21_ARTAN|nr:glutamine-dependent NAD(+) synthetase [Artemisia annua]